MALLLPAKLVRPSATGVVERAELQARLDTALGGKLIWISGPAGAGKTSLVSGWIQSRGLTALWYQIDAGDEDPATLFHYLGLGAATLRPPDLRDLAPPLPHLTPEYLPGLNVFVRHFFETLTAPVIGPAVIVFDDYHEAQSSGSLNNLVNIGIDSLAPAVTVVVISRGPPPQDFANLSNESAFTVFDQHALKLNPTEASAIASARGVLDPLLISRVVELADGWAAGVTLLARAAARGLLVDAKVHPAGDATWGYFETEVFGLFDARQQSDLLRLALTRTISNKVARIVSDRALVLLEELHARQMFVERRVDGSDHVYRLHPLFRDFLLARGTIGLTDDDRRSVRMRMAQALEDEGRTEDAIDRWREVGDWVNVCRLVVSHAPGLLGEGRFRTVEALINGVPTSLVETNGWLRLWRGSSRSLTDPVAGRHELEAACRCFETGGDEVGALLACAGILNSYFLARADYGSAYGWIDKTDRLYERLQGKLSPAMEATILTALGWPMDLGFGHPLWRRALRRARRLLQDASDPGVIVPLSSFGVMVQILSGNFHEADNMQRALADVAGHPASPPMLRILSAINECVLGWLQGRIENAYGHAERARQVAAESGIAIFNSAIEGQAAYVALAVGDADTAERAVTAAMAQCPASRLTELEHLRCLGAAVWMVRGDLTRAIAMYRESVDSLKRLSACFGETAIRIQLGQALMLAGEHAESRMSLSRGLELSREVRSEIAEFQALMALSWSSLDEGDEEAGLTHLRAALALGARRNYMNCHPVWIPKVMARLFEAALEAGIEVPYVQRFIAHRRLAPLSSETPEWPWPIRMHALGRFEVLVGGRPMEQGRKEQRRLLELVKALVACGGESVARQVLVDALWPEGEGDAATHAFDVTLHRLRKALGRDDAVVVAHGQVSLNREVVWVDALAFDRLVDRLERGEAGGEAQERRLIERALGLYRGAFLTAGDDAPLHLAYRQRLRRRYRRMVVLAAQRLAPARAATCLARAIEIEPEADEFDAALRAMTAAQPNP